MKILIIIILVVIVLWLIASHIAISNLEEPQYEVISKSESYEIRLYQPYIIAETTVSGSYREALNKGFSNIADYIFGNNTANDKIAMTVPVKEEINNNSVAEKIAMTVPVINTGDSKERKISFVMPSKYTIDSIPKPNTDKVTLIEIPEKKIAVLRYNWYTNEKRTKEKSDILRAQLEEDGIETVGEISSARYNPPFSIPILLRNEILIEIK